MRPPQGAGQLWRQNRHCLENRCDCSNEDVDSGSLYRGLTSGRTGIASDSARTGTDWPIDTDPGTVTRDRFSALHEIRPLSDESEIAVFQEEAFERNFFKTAGQRWPVFSHIPLVLPFSNLAIPANPMCFPKSLFPFSG